MQRRIGLHFFAELVGKFFDFDAAEQFLDGFGAHFGVELAGIFFLQLAVFVLEQNFTFAKHSDFAGVHDHKGFEIQDALEVAHGDIQQIADAAGQPLKEPHMRTRGSELDMAEALATNLAEGNFHAAFIADDAAMLHALVFAAQTFPIGDGAKYFGAEKAVAFGFEGAVIDGLRLGDFAVRPRADFFRTRQTDSNGIKIGD